VAGTPLKVTVFWVDVVLKPVPKIVTDVPTGPLLVDISMTDTAEEFWRTMDRRFPTAS
jgi:hypothetical protein